MGFAEREYIGRSQIYGEFARLWQEMGTKVMCLELGEIGVVRPKGAFGENSVFGRVGRLNRYLSVAFLRSGIPLMKTISPMGDIPVLCRRSRLSGIFATANLAIFPGNMKKYRLRDGICDSYSWFRYVLHTYK